MLMKRLLLVLAAAALLLGVLPVAAASAAIAPFEQAVTRPDIHATATVDTDAAAMHRATGDWIYSNVTNPTLGSAGGEWAILGLARSEYDATDRYATYFDNLIAVLDANGGVLSTSKYTEYSRVIIALGALGIEATNVGGYNLLSYLADYNKVTRQGLNGAAFALIALDTHGYAIPDIGGVSRLTTRDDLISFILDKELAGGGWVLTGSDPDPDTTAMAIQALAPYREANPDVHAAVNRALVVLSGLQQADGGYKCFGVANLESIAQVIMVLCTLGIDPLADPRFVKNDATLFSALSSYYLDGGGFRHIVDGQFDQFATEQGYCALTAYLRLVNGQTSFYDMSDVQIAHIPVTAVSLPPTASVAVGRTINLTARVTPANATDKSLNWTSDNAAVATVDLNGSVTGVAEGVATIRATANDGSGQYATCTVTVTAITPVTFIDVPSSDLYHAAIAALADLGIIGGYDTPRGKEYRPGNPILRAQVAKMLVMAFGLHDETITGADRPVFSDVPLSSGVPYPFDFVQEAAMNGLIHGFPDQTFRPYAEVTRIQLLRMLVRGAGDRLATPPAGYEVSFADVDPADRDVVATGVYNGIINGKSASRFDPWGCATRGQFAKMLYNVLER